MQRSLVALTSAEYEHHQTVSHKQDHQTDLEDRFHQENDIYRTRRHSCAKGKTIDAVPEHMDMLHSEKGPGVWLIFTKRGQMKPKYFSRRSWLRLHETEVI